MPGAKRIPVLRRVAAQAACTVPSRHCAVDLVHPSTAVLTPVTANADERGRCQRASSVTNVCGSSDSPLRLTTACLCGRSRWETCRLAVEIAPFGTAALFHAPN